MLLNVRQDSANSCEKPVAEESQLRNFWPKKAWAARDFPRFCAREAQPQFLSQVDIQDKDTNEQWLIEFN